MMDARGHPEAAQGLPAANVRRRRWSFPLVWIVPLVAAIVAGYLVYQRVREVGPTIRIAFKDAGGLKAGDTEIKYRGVTVGQVTAIELSGNLEHALVKARLRRSSVSVAREGSSFWIVRPELTLSNISGLGTVISGSYIEVLPGSGRAKWEFVGLETSPVTLERNPLKIILRSSRVGSVKVNTPVYYRGIEVGTVQSADLSPIASAVDIHVQIKHRYASLVRNDTQFWNVSGADVSVGLFRGLEVKMESVKSLVAGGIAFATPNNPKATPVRNGTIFPLNAEPKKEWLEWAPEIQIPPDR